MKFRVFFTLSISTFIGYQLTNYFQEYSFFSPIFLFIVNGLFFIVFCINLFADYNDFKSCKSKSAFIATLFGFLLYPLLVVVYQYQKYPLTKTNLLSFTHRSGVNGTTINLKKDGTFVIDDFSNLGGTYYNGNYTRTDSTIYLKNCSKIGFPISKFYISENDTELFEIKNKSINYNKKYD